MTSYWIQIKLIALTYHQVMRKLNDRAQALTKRNKYLLYRTSSCQRNKNWTMLMRAKRSLTMEKRNMAMRRTNIKMAKIDRWLLLVNLCRQRPAICELFKKTCKNEVIQLSQETRISGQFHILKKIRMTIFKTKARVQPRGINDLHHIQQHIAAHNEKSIVQAIKSPSRARILRKV